VNEGWITLRRPECLPHVPWVRGGAEPVGVRAAPVGEAARCMRVRCGASANPQHTLAEQYREVKVKVWILEFQNGNVRVDRTKAAECGCRGAAGE
jgi:hypothetical protein